MPVDLGSTATTTITEKAYAALRVRLGLPAVTARILSFTAGSVLPDADVLEHFRIDARGVKPGAGQGPAAAVTVEGDYEIFRNEWGAVFRRPLDSGLYFDLWRHPLEGRDRDFIRRHPFPRGDDPARVRGLRERCRALRDAGYPVVMSQSFGTGILHGGTALFGFEDYFCRMMLEPEVIDEVGERLLEGKIAFWDSVLTECEGLIDVVTEADDLGTQRGPFIGVEDYRRRIKPFQRRLFSFIKSRAPEVKILFHSCGAVADFIPDLIEIGVDALNPVQTSARGMDPAFLKREYGRDLCFWGGGVDTQEILPRGSPGDVRNDVRRRLPVLLDGGGYVFAAVHNIQADVPPENITALFAAVDEFR